MSDPVTLFDFAKNEEWKVYFGRLEFSGIPTVTQVLKAKRRWYKKNIDPDYDANKYSKPQQQQQQPQQQQQSQQPQPQPKPQQQQPQPQQPQPQQPQQTNNQQQQHQQKTQWELFSEQLNLFRSQANFSLVVEFCKNNKLVAASYAVHCFILFNTLFTCLLFVFYGGEGFRRSFKGSLVSLLITLCQNPAIRNFQANQQYLALLQTNTSFHYVLYTVLFLTSSPTLISFAPLFIESLYRASVLTEKLLNRALPSNLQQRMTQELSSQYVVAQEKIALFEVLQIVLVLYEFLFTGQISIFQVIMYFQFLKLRYQFNPQTKRVVDHLKMLAYPYVPIGLRSMLF